MNKKTLLIGLAILVIAITAITLNGSLLQGKINFGNIIYEQPNPKAINNFRLRPIELSNSLTAVLAFKNSHYLDAAQLTEKNIDQGITREQGVHIIFQALNPIIGKAVQSSYQNCYTDTIGSYAETSICWTKNQNLWVKSGSQFTPQLPMRRDEATNLINNILKEKFFSDMEATTSTVVPFPDIVSAGNNNPLKENLKLLVYKNILPFDPKSNFSAEKNITLRELSEMLFRAKLTYNSKSTAFSQSLVTSLNENGGTICRTGNLFPEKTEKVEEKINYVISDYSAKAYPNWKQEIDKFMVEVNKLYEPVGISFKIQNYLVMPDGKKDFPTYISQHPEYFYENNKTGVVKGLTIFACLSSDLNNFNALCPFSIGSGGYRTRAGNTLIQNQNYAYVNFGQEEAKFANLSPDYTSTMAHEIGHSFDISMSPIEWYSLAGIDGIYPPNASYYVDYQLCKDNVEYGNDPMCSYYSNSSAFSTYSKKLLLINKFHDLSRFIINPTSLTSNYTNSFYQPMADFHAEKIKVNVRKDGKPVPSTEVQVLWPEISKNGFALEYVKSFGTFKTNAEGIVFLDAPYLSQDFNSMLIKVQNATSVAKKFVTYLETQKTAMVDNQCTYEVTMDLQ